MQGSGDGQGPRQWQGGDEGGGWERGREGEIHAGFSCLNPFNVSKRKAFYKGLYLNHLQSVFKNTRMHNWDFFFFIHKHLHNSWMRVGGWPKDRAGLAGVLETRLEGEEGLGTGTLIMLILMLILLLLLEARGKRCLSVSLSLSVFF